MPSERYQRIKEAVSAAQVAEDHGLQLEADGQGREKALCPFHDDHDPSLKLFADGGYKCFACDAAGDAVSLEQTLGGHSSASEAASAIEERHFLTDAGDGLATVSSIRQPRRPAPAPKAEAAPKKEAEEKPKEVRREEVARWTVRDASDVAQAIHIRYRVFYEDGSEGKAYSYRNADGSWEQGAIKTRKLPLYLSEQVSGYDPAELVILVEGEKAADAAAKAGLQVVATTAGTNVVPDGEYLEILRGYKLTLWPDADDPGHKHMAEMAEALKDIAAEVRWFSWEEAPETGDAADHPAVTGGEGLNDLQQALREAPAYDPEQHRPKDPKGKAAKQGGSGVPTAGGLPAIVVNGRQMRTITDETVGALVAANQPPRLFERSSEPSRVVVSEEGNPQIQSLGKNEVRHDMARAANFYRINAEGDPKDVSPPSNIADDILAMPNRPFPPLAGVVETPILRADGTIHDTPGYDPHTGFYFWPAPGFSMPKVPESPTDTDIAGALGLLMEAIGEFPYDSESSMANALALLLTPVLRQAIDGLAPLLLIEKPQAGTGGSLLAEVASKIATGREAEMLGAPDNDEEWRKQITAKLLGGSTLITIDNIEGALYAPSLARALTAYTWSDRVLGLSRSATVAQNATWMATGNNIILRGDLPRRCVSIRLDAKTSRPWQRTGFRHPHLLGWVQSNRGELIRALLILARGWINAGRPEAPGLPKLGNYEAWSETVGGILAYAGVPGFLSNLETLYRKSAQGDTEWESFFASWFEAVGSEAITVSELTDKIEQDDSLKESVPPYLEEALERNRGSFVRKLGNALAKNEGKRYGDDNLHAVRTGERRRAVTWKLEKGPSGCELTSFVSLYNPARNQNGENGRIEGGEIKNRVGEINSPNSLTHTYGESSEATYETREQDIDEALEDLDAGGEASDTFGSDTSGNAGGDDMEARLDALIEREVDGEEKGE